MTCHRAWTHVTREKCSGSRVTKSQKCLKWLSTTVDVAVTRVHAKSIQSCLTLCHPMECSPSGSSVHAIFSARKRSGCHALLQGIFPTQRLNPHLLSGRQVFCQQVHLGSPAVTYWLTSLRHYSHCFMYINAWNPHIPMRYLLLLFLSEETNWNTEKFKICSRSPIKRVELRVKAIWTNSRIHS